MPGEGALPHSTQPPHRRHHFTHRRLCLGEIRSICTHLHTCEARCTSTSLGQDHHKHPKWAPGELSGVCLSLERVLSLPHHRACLSALRTFRELSEGHSPRDLQSHISYRAESHLLTTPPNLLGLLAWLFLSGVLTVPAVVCGRLWRLGFNICCRSLTPEHIFVSVCLCVCLFVNPDLFSSLASLLMLW